MAARFVRLVVALALTLTGAVGISLATTTAAQAIPDRDCGDFGSQAAAQDFYIDHGGPRSDPHRLDDDNDGVACESNPCPCSDRQGGGGGHHNPPPPKPRKQVARVIKVIDGDTIRVKIIGGRQRDVRLLGIDTPEIYGGVECGAREASRYMKQLLPRRTKVTLIPDRSQADTDRYKRLLRYVHRRHDGRAIDASWAQVRLGNATVFVVGNRFARFAGYKKAQNQAKRETRGIWGSCR